MSASFFSMILRMRYINRWGLMRNTNLENLSEHSFDVAVLSHALAVLGNRRLNKHYDSSRAALLGLFHDAGEIITGDMPTPIKYYNEGMTAAYRKIEEEAEQTLISMLPPDLKEEYEGFFQKEPADAELWKIVKGADRLSALIKCVEEEKSGNREFGKAKQATLDAIHQMELPELELFLDEFFDSFSKTLDEQ